MGPMGMTVGGREGPTVRSPPIIVCRPGRPPRSQNPDDEGRRPFCKAPLENPGKFLGRQPKWAGRFGTGTSGPRDSNPSCNPHCRSGHLCILYRHKGTSLCLCRHRCCILYRHRGCWGWSHGRGWKWNGALLIVQVIGNRKCSNSSSRFIAFPTTTRSLRHGMQRRCQHKRFVNNIRIRTPSPNTLLPRRTISQAHT